MVEQATDKQEQTFGNLINPYTNKPVHTGKSVSFNQNTYDDINYIQAKNNLLKDFNINMTRPQSVNAQALYDIPVIPEFIKEEYQDAYSAGNWLESLNIATPEEIDEWRAMGKMGIGETAQRLKSLKSAKYIPFVGTTAEVGYNLDMLSAVNRLKKGEQISDVERDLLVDYLREIKEIQVRGTTLPSKALTAILESVPYMVEFGVGVAAAPETFGGGLAASGAALTKAAGKKAARKAVAKALQKAAVESTMTGTKKALSMSAAKTLYKNTYDSMLKAGATKAVKEVGMKEAAKIVAKNTPKDMARAAFGSPVLTYMTAKNTVGGVAERQLGGSMQVTDAGEAVFLEPENMALSIMKAFGTSVFDNYTETMGWAFAPVSSYFAKPVRKVLPQKFFTGFEKLVSSRYGMPAAEALKKFGYDGVLEEMGEELLNRFLCQTFGINGLDEYTFDGFMNNVFYANDPEQWLVEAISFAAMGGAAHSAYGISSDVKKRYDEAQNKKIAAKLAELANKRIYSPAEYYLEQGLIKINGSQSEAEKMLREKFEERGVDKNTADDFVNNSSELEIRKQLKQFIDEDEADADKRREKAVNYLADKMLENQSYNNKDMAQKNANLIVTALEKLSETNGIPIEELINNEAPKILNQSMNENATPEQEKNREIEARLQELENEFSNMNEENWDDEKFVTLENEYNNLVELKNQGEVYYQDANIAGAENGELLKAAKEWEEKGTESQYFKKWFGDSKVVDENGNPLVVYHGTNAEFNIFKYDKNNQTGFDFGEAYYFTSNSDKASGYAYNPEKDSRIIELEKQRKGIVAKILSIAETKTFKIKDKNKYNELKKEHKQLTDEINFIRENGKAEDTNGIVMPIYLKLENPLIVNAQGKYYFEVYENYFEEARKNNNDGIIVKNVIDNPRGEFIPMDVYIAFSPEQIKSVDNNGKFDSTNPNIYYQAAYHGTPHNFAKFSTDNIGTGEGATAHGWGLYFAEDKKVSEEYRKILSEGRSKWFYGDKEVSSIVKGADIGLYKRTKIIGKKEMLEGLNKRLKAAEEKYLKNKEEDDKIAFKLLGDFGVNLNEIEIRDIKRQIKIVEGIDESKIEHKEVKGQLLKVDIPENDVLLDEDKLLGNMVLKEGLVEKLLDWAEENALYYNVSLNHTGAEIYDSISDKLGGDKQASELLNSLGFKGITYEGHRDGRCYVVFDDKAIKTLKKYYQTDYTQFSVDELESIGKYRNFVENVLSGKLSNKEKSQLFYLGKTPAKLVEAGLSNNGLYVSHKIIKKAQDKRNNDHNLSQETISNVFEALYNPIAVIKAEQNKNEKKENNRYSVILDLQNEQGNYVLAAIETDKQNKEILINDIRSIHSRVDYSPIIDKALDDGRLLKIDIDKTNDLLKPHKADIISAGATSLINRLYQQQNNVKYYQSAYQENENNVVDLTNVFDKVPTFEEVKKHLYEIINSGISFDTKTKGFKIDIKQTDVKRNGKKPTNVVNKLTKKGNTKQPQSVIKRNNKYLIAIEQLIKNSELKRNNDKNTDGHENSKKSEKPHVKQYYNFDVPVRIGESIYIVRLQAEEWEGDKPQEGIKTLHLYNIYENKKSSRLATMDRLNNSTREDDSSIKQTNNNIKYQDDTQGNLFFDVNKAKRFRNMMKNSSRGSYVPAEKIIELYKTANASTFLHEMGHLYLDMISKYSGDSEKLSEELDAVRKWLKNDGGEFTVEQHEKFARGFEAYMRSGYAKNNKIKKVFEYFKNFLLQIYDSIQHLGFKKEDMPEIIELYDNLMTTERERIKATVFDKIAEIDEKIDNIRENEKEEFKELDEIWKDNIAILNRRSDKKRKVEEYIQLAETIPFRETKETREWKQRYKNATLDILATYSGKSRSWVANSRNWEKLQDLIGQANDGIFASNGFLQEWAEFYTDTGVSYENSEVGADEELAQQAFDVMVAGDYNHTSDENYEFRDIDAFVSKIDYLAAKIKTVKGEEKNVVFEALTTLFSKMPGMPDDVTAEISKKLIKAGEELEEDTKEDFNRKVYPSIPIVQQLQFYITKKLNDLKVYNPETRYKMRLNKSHRLYKYIQNVNSVNQAKKQIKKINEFIIDDMRNNQRSLLHKEIQKQIRVNSKLVKVGTMTKGKFNWKTNTCFAELVQMNKMDRKDAEKELGAITQIQYAAKSESRDSFDENETGEFNKSNDFQDILKKEFLQYRSMRLQDLDVIHTIQLLQDILELKEQGRKAKSEEDFISRTQKWNTKNNLLDLLEITKQSGAQFGANWIAGVGGAISLNGGTLANWESLLNAVFNKDTAQKYSLLKDEADSDVYARKHMLNFYDRAADIYGFKKPSGFDKFLDYDNTQPLIELFQEYDKEKDTYMQQVFSINSPDGIARSSIELSRSQLITMFAWSLNDQLEQRLMTQFGVEQIRDMFENKLSKEDKDLAWALVDTCESMREDINEVFIRTTGLSLPAVQNYFPSKAERVQSDIDMYHDFFVKSTNPSFIKQRKTCNRIPMKPMSPLEILIPHINKTAKYVILSEKVNWLNQIFKDTAIKTKLQEIWGSKNGEKIYQTMINKLAACTFTNYSKGNNLIAGWLDTMSRNYITSSIGFSGKVALGQLLSVVNYAENMPAMTWAKGFKETLKHPVEAFNYMLENCEYLQTRLAGNSQNEVMAILTSEKDKFRTLRNFMTSNVKWGDIIAITLGGKPYVDYLMNEKGMSKEDAFNKFVEDTLRAQQAGTTSSISEWQSAQAKNCLTRMIFAFRNTDIQYERKFWDTLIQAKKGDIDKKEAIKKLFIYKVLNPFMFTSFLQNMSILALFRGIFAGDDDTITTFLKTAVEAIMLGGVNAYGYAGFLTVGLLESLFALFDRDYKHFETTMPVLTDIDHIVQKFTKGDLEFADWVDGIATSSEFFIGVPTSKLVNFVEGAADTIKGNVGVGLSRMAGWGRYTSTKAWTGEPPEKERKKRKKRKK